MLGAYIFVAASVLATLGLLWLVRSQLRTAKRLETRAVQDLCPVDLEAFRNLVDPEESRFCQRMFPPAEFRRLQRQRMIAAQEYLKAMRANAEILQSIGMRALESGAGEQAAAVTQMLHTATRVRVRSTVLLWSYWLSLKLRIPVNTLSPVDVYRDLRNQTLTVLQVLSPAESTQIIRSWSY